MLLEITDNDIEYAEQILLPANQRFDQERRDYLKFIDTCDLQAVPGSGKTTVLLAKLLIIERYLPFESGCGVLVISHTNTAVNEIKARIGQYCPRLFSYPNFIGTIQAFIDYFLAVPCYSQAFKKKIIRIDNEVYEEKVMKYRLPYAAENWLKNRNDPNKFLLSLRLDSEFKLIDSITSKARDFVLKDPNKNTYKAFKKMKLDILEMGYLHYDDAYTLAEIYIKRYPIVITGLKKRFGYVFVDEMQDMEKHQHDILESLFFSEVGYPVYQRIGDSNQSIFSEQASTAELNWSLRSHVLSLEGSHRLNESVAKILNSFTVGNNIALRGLNISNNIKPHILLFSPETKSNVIRAFAELIKHYQNESIIPVNLRHPVKAIGWNGKDPEPDKLRIKDYFSGYNRNGQSIQNVYSNFLSHLTFYDKESRTLDSIRKSILNGILRVLRLEDLKIDGRDYTKKTFLNSLKLNYPEKYSDFSINLYKWCFSVIQGHVDLAHSEIKLYLPGFFQDVFGLQSLSPLSNIFLNEDSILEIQEETNETLNVINFEDLKVDVTSIHSVKGETHTATLYLETCYHQHESQKSLQPLLGINVTASEGVNKVKSSRMMYVGFSRPTHLLCFAALEGRITPHIKKLEALGWEIVNVGNVVSPMEPNKVTQPNDAT